MRYIVGGVTILVLHAGCVICPPEIPFLDSQDAPPALEKFTSQEELINFMQSQAEQQFAGQPFCVEPAELLFMPFLFPLALLGGQPMAIQADGFAVSAEAGGRGDVAADDFSTTNIQEAGVDESDVIKNDGEFCYVLTRGKLQIARIHPAAQMEVLGEVELEGFPDSIYLRGDVVAALTTGSESFGFGGPIFTPGVFRGGIEPSAQADADSTSDWSQRTNVFLIDATDRSAPSITEEFAFEGRLNTSRMIDGRLHLILTSYPYIPYETAEGESDQSVVLPEFRTEVQGQLQTGDLVNWENAYHPIEPNGYSVTTVATIDTDNPTAEFDSISVVADAGTVYASTNALYVTDTDYSFTSSSARENTAIHKFDLTGEQVAYTTSGHVSGRLLNQFSLGEHEGYLRVATTTGNTGFLGGEASNHVFVLGAEEDGLSVVGSIENIAPGEEIFSARFLGARGFLVTFKKVDPLFTLDLSDPRNPLAVGELKVPGYSDYIHPFGENHLLTVGKDAEPAVEGDFAWYQGVQLSVFDVSDFANPTLLHKHLIGSRGTESEALHNHKAFTYLASQDLLAIPIDLYEGGMGGSSYGEYAGSGLFVFRVTIDDGFSELGRIQTSSAGAFYDYYAAGWTRGVVIGENVYAVTDDAILAATIDDEISGAEWTLNLPENADE